MGIQTLESLPKTMAAVVCHGPEDYRLEEYPTPTPGPGEVLLRVESVGICASDLKCYMGAPLFWGTGDTPGYCQPPVIPGHEFVGRVVALGEGAGEKYGLSLGDVAVSEQIVPCWQCRFCQRGQYWMCPNGDVYGFRQRAFGAMAEYVRLPADAINYRVPETVPVAHAVFIEPLACSIHAVQRGEIELDHVVVIAGAGPLGLGMVAAARLKNPHLLVAIDLNDHRLEIARKCGADLVLNPRQVDVVEEVLKLTDGYGCDVYIEATGHPAAVTQGLAMIRRLGTFVEFSVMREPVTVDWTVIGDLKELNIHGSHLGPYCYPIAMEMLAKGLLPMEEILTHSLPLASFEQGIELVHAGTESIKVTLQP
ncbi:MAG: erythritol/L-threitol dehydrogenase [Litorilinea sp.]|nr:MAG: erythritol/L-threitol dehydrogenase [Litorilinea sp.]